MQESGSSSGQGQGGPSLCLEWKNLNYYVPAQEQSNYSFYPAGFECLLDFKWPIWALHICKCPSTCTEIEYTMQTVKKSSWGVKNNEEVASSETATSSFRWDLIPPKVRMRRDVVYSFEDLVGECS